MSDTFDELRVCLHRTGAIHDALRRLCAGQETPADVQRQLAALETDLEVIIDAVQTQQRIEWERRRPVHRVVRTPLESSRLVPTIPRHGVDGRLVSDLPPLSGRWNERGRTRRRA